MLTAQRRQIILDRLSRDGQVSVPTLSQEWGVSEDTVRRDLRDLAEEGLVLRVHGGALPASKAVANYEGRQVLSVEVKQALARRAADFVRPGMVIAVDGGTSTLQLVRELPRTMACTIVTHSPLIAAELRHHQQVEVLLVGGKLFRHSMVAVGSETVDTLGRIHTDLFFLGATGIHPEHGATTGDWEEAAVKRAFCRASAEVVLMVSPEKWGAASAFQIVPTMELSTLVVSSQTDEASIAPYRALGVSVFRADNVEGGTTDGEANARKTGRSDSSSV